MFFGNNSAESRIFLSWGFSCLFLGILVSSLPDFVTHFDALAALFPNEAVFNFFHGFADGFSLVLIIVSLFLNLKTVRGGASTGIPI